MNRLTKYLSFMSMAAVLVIFLLHTDATLVAEHPISFVIMYFVGVFAGVAAMI